MDESQPVGSRHHADRARRVDDRSAGLSPQPRPRQELRRVLEPARHQAARPARRARSRGSRFVEGAAKQRVPKGTQVSTPQATEQHVVTFETARDIVVTVARPDRCFSYFDDAYSENSRYIDPVPGSIDRRVRGVRRRTAHRALSVPVGCAVRQHRRGVAAARVPRHARARRPRSGALAWSGSTGTARVGRSSSPRRSRSIAARSRFSAR